MSLVDGEHLVSVAWLAERLGDPEVRVFDCTVHLRPDPPRPYRIESGRSDWLAGHVPGAGFLDLTGPLSDRSAAVPFMAPPPDELAAAFAGAGVDEEARVVLYSTNHPMWATRAWWMLRSIGFDRAAVLDGGFSAWRDAGGSVETGAVEVPPGRLSALPRPSLWAGREEVLARVGDRGVCTLNALPPATYRGDGGRDYGRPGHITGSVNVPYAELFEPDTGAFRDATSLRATFDTVGAFERPVICYCGGGISATCDAFALTLLGHEQVAVYDGSMSEWVRDPSLPMTTGAEPGTPDTASAG